MVVWQDDEQVDDAICADTVFFWQRHRFAQTPGPTAYNNAHHLALDPATGWLHMVYAEGHPNYEPIYYTYSTDQGEHWWPREYVGQGVFPCIACEGQGGLVWVSHVYGDHRATLRTHARVAPGQWVTHDVSYNLHSPPSMVVSHESPATDPAVYVLYVAKYGDYAYNVEFNVVSVEQGPHTPEVVWGPSGDALYTPSVAATPGDIVHAMWMMPAQGGLGGVFYRQRVNGVWSALEEVTGLPAPPATKPADFPSAEAYGDLVYAAWQGGYGPREVWRASRPVVQGWWGGWSNLSQTSGTPSQYPQQSTHWATAWQDPVFSPVQEDIWANIFDQVVPIWQDLLRSTYPNIMAEWSSIYEPPRLFVHTMWSSEVPAGDPAPYEVLFTRYEHIPGDGWGDFSYYDCGVGDSVKARYCLARDCCARWRDFRVDLGRKNLCYRLPYLNPAFDYVLKAVAYQVGKDTWQQRFALDSIDVAHVAYRPFRPETVLVPLPRETYQRDCEVILDVSRAVGDFAVVAELKLCECFPYRRGEAGAQGSSLAVREPALRLSQPWPSPFSNATSVSYVLSTSRYVDVRALDVQGRLVRLVASGRAGPGTHAVRWNGLGDDGRRVPAGAYILRVESDGSTVTRKVVMTR